MQHCALRRLPGKGALSGEILSHDFVEAALMRRAGWGVWLAYDLAGSYEEMPPNLLDELQRDRRWCQGNLMNFAAAADEGLASGAPRRVHDRRDGVPVGAAVVPVPRAVDGAARDAHAGRRPSTSSSRTSSFRSWPRVAARLGAEPRRRRRRCCCSCPRCSRVLLVRAARARAATAAQRKLVASVAGEIARCPRCSRRSACCSTRASSLTALRGCVSAVEIAAARRRADDVGARRCGGTALQTLFGVAWTAVVYWLDPAFLWWLAAGRRAR